MAAALVTSRAWTDAAGGSGSDEGATYSMGATTGRQPIASSRSAVSAAPAAGRVTRTPSAAGPSNG